MTENQQVYRDVLTKGYVLHWYEVESVLGRGAFGVTYLALDKNLEQLNNWGQSKIKHAVMSKLQQGV